MIIVSCKGIQLGLATFVGNFFHSHTLRLSPQVSIRRLSLVVREHNSLYKYGVRPQFKEFKRHLSKGPCRPI